MDKRALRRRATELYADEVQYAIAADERVELEACRSRAAMRLAREADAQTVSVVWLGYVEGIARGVEREFEDDLAVGVLRIGGAIRVDDLVFVPTDRARERDWLTVDERHELKFQEHAAKRERERVVIHGIVDRLRGHGGDPTTIEACPDLFRTDEAAAG